MSTGEVQPGLSGGASPTVLTVDDEAGTLACFHCGEPCDHSRLVRGDRTFCCQGCLLVHDLLAETKLHHYYDLSRHPGVRPTRAELGPDRWACLDEPRVQERLLDFTDGKISRVTLRIPAIHCIACVWLLENLFRLRPGIGTSRVNFLRREATITFSTREMALSELVRFLSSIGYEPQLRLDELDKPAQGKSAEPAHRRQWLQTGLAGFAFGNIMLFSLPAYFGLDSLSGPFFKGLFGWLSLALAAPVLVFSASDYWRSARLALRQRVLTLDVPIALGLAALYARSAFEIASGQGAGYLDSLAGLVFFLLCGRLFQQKTHDRLAFDRDYKCFFPLSVVRKTDAGEESVVISAVRPGDRLVLRNKELIPADARLVQGQGLIDYSFVTGESAPSACEPGAHLYAGGRQLGAAIEAETLKPVSQSYLASLWNQDAFRKPREDRLRTLTNRYSRRFTLLVLCVATGAGLAWLAAGHAGTGLKAFASVLIVACPCALALAEPFTFGTAQRLLARRQVFLRNGAVLERLAEVDAIVFDKTGTLTPARAGEARFLAEAREPGSEPALNGEEAGWVCSLARQSHHPHSARIAESLAGRGEPGPVSGFSETPGAGITGRVQGHQIRLGSRAWLESAGIPCGEPGPEGGAHVEPSGGVEAEAGQWHGGTVCVGIDGKFRGAFILVNHLRPQADTLPRRLGRRYELALLSGDNPNERERFQALLGTEARTRFNQSPLEKLEFIRHLQQRGRTVMMVGDGLNDAGALQQSDVGVAVVEKTGAFSPASDVIIEAAQVAYLAEVLSLARRATRIVRLSFAISALYNAVGIAIAAAGLMSPVICAILMPLSSVSVVLFACAATNWANRKAGLADGAASGGNAPAELPAPHPLQPVTGGRAA